jgi:hypothetical protein
MAVDRQSLLMLSDLKTALGSMTTADRHRWLRDHIPKPRRRCFPEDHHRNPVLVIETFSNPFPKGEYANVADNDDTE